MADISIDASIGNMTGHGMRSVVFTSASVGYWFYFDGDGTFGYSKTTDGGASWGAQVEIDADTTGLAYDVWFDQWTPGDSGTLIHLVWFDSTADDVYWRSLDTATDTLGTRRVVFAGGSALNGRGNFASVAKSRSGYLYCAFDIDAGAEKGLYRSTDSGTTWGVLGDGTFVEASLDKCMLYPASNTGDNNDIWAVYQDASADELTLKMWDSSAAGAVESAVIMPQVEDTVNLQGEGFSASVRHSDGHLIVAGVSERDTATADHRVFDINGTGSITELTAITTDIDDHYYPAVFIDQDTDFIFVAYNGKRDGSEGLSSASKVYYTKSENDGTTWSAGDTAYMEDAAAVVFQVWAPLMGPRFYAGWRISTTLLGGFTNSLTDFGGAASARPVVFVCT